MPQAPRLVSLSGLVLLALVGSLLQQAAHSQTGGVELVSKTPGGSASGLSGTDGGAALSTGSFMIRNRFGDDGRLVVFESSSFSLTCQDLNTFRDIFIRDRHAGTNTIVNLAWDGASANDSSFEPTITPDGRYIAFTSQATNLVIGDTNGFLDVFVRDLQTGAIQRATVSSAGDEANLHSHNAAISDDGRFVAFDSQASNLIANDANNAEDVFVRDTLTGTTERVSIGSGGEEGLLPSHSAGISADGRYVVFESRASNLVAGDTNGLADIFVRDRLTGITSMVSVNTTGGPTNLGAREPAISPDGRYVTYASTSTDIVVPDPSGGFFYSIYMYDRVSGITVRVSVAPDGVTRADRDARLPSVSTDGRFVTFESWATNLVEGDLNDNWDIFRRDMVLGTTELISPMTSQISSVSPDGSLVYFQSFSKLVAEDVNFTSDVYLYGPPAPTSTPGISLSAPSYTQLEADGPVTVTVNRVGDICTAATVDFATSDGTAVAGSDYQAMSGTLEFASGETSKTFDVTIIDDGNIEGDETFTVTLSNPTGAVLSTPFNATITISNDDVDLTPPSGTIAVNNGATWTKTASVTLNLSCVDPVPSTGCTDMQFSNDNVTFTPFEPFAATKPWTLTAGEGTKNVYVRYRDGAGSVSATFSDAIKFDATAPVITRVIDTPDPFTPSLGQVTSFEYKLSDAQSHFCLVVAQIFSSTGPVAQLNGITLCTPSGALNVLAWNGRNTAGQIVAPGTYYYRIVAIDQAFNVRIGPFAPTTVQ